MLFSCSVLLGFGSGNRSDFCYRTCSVWFEQNGKTLLRSVTTKKILIFRGVVFMMLRFCMRGRVGRLYRQSMDGSNWGWYRGGSVQAGYLRKQIIS